MVFYATTENPNVMMRENHKTQSCEYIIICQDGLYIVATIPEEILYRLKENTRLIFIFKINTYMILVQKIIIKSKNILNIYMKI